MHILKSIFLAFTLLAILPSAGHSQVDGDQMGAWYMYFWNAKLGTKKLGLQGDVQFRNWNIAGDLEQLLLRGGLTYRATDQTLLTLGYAHITTGEFGDGDATTSESRVYQEALLSHKISKRVLLRHRFRYEQRWVVEQDFRTRYRYNLFLTIPLTAKLMEAGGVYLSLYNELFINGQKDIGAGSTVAIFDRNRIYGAIGYIVRSGLNIQLGTMKQTTNSWSKNQLQLSVHSTF